ncbi:MAG: hypothetical protein HRT35_34975, partial [Algicola sp.]|nr:hypothetical protein [Algicola sp.]
MKTDNTTMAAKVKRVYTLWLMLLCILTNLLVGITAASAGAWDTMRHRSGWILTRGLVYSDSGKIIYSHYNTAGDTIGDIGPAEGPLENAKVMAADEYRQVVDYFNNFKNEHRDGIAKGATVMTAQAYNDAVFTTVSGEAVNKPQLLPSSKSALVRSSQQLLISANSPLLLQATIDLSDARALGGGTKSVLLDKDGKIHTTSTNTI